MTYPETLDRPTSGLGIWILAVFLVLSVVLSVVALWLPACPIEPVTVTIVAVTSVGNHAGAATWVEFSDGRRDILRGVSLGEVGDDVVIAHRVCR